MWSYEHSLETKARPETVFDIFRDVSRWHEWNAGIERIELDGPFATGASGVMVIPDQGRLAFRLAWVGEGQGFEDETPIPDADMVVRVRHFRSRWPAVRGSPIGPPSRDRTRTRSALRSP